MPGWRRAQSSVLDGQSSSIHTRVSPESGLATFQSGDSAHFRGALQMASAQTATFDIVYAQNRLISMLFLLVVQTGTRHLYKMDCLGTTTVLAKDDKNSETARFRLSA